MQLVFVSDTHGDRQILEQIIQQQPKADGFFYAGDSELPATSAIWTTYKPVAGNMDFDPDYPLTLTQPIGQDVLFMTHGHRFNVNFDLTPLLEAAKKAAATLVVFGHTHQLGVEQHAGMVVLNPGSIRQPRGAFAKIGGTYAVVTTSAESIDVAYYNRKGELQVELTRRFSRAR